MLSVLHGGTSNGGFVGYGMAGLGAIDHTANIKHFYNYSLQRDPLPSEIKAWSDVVNSGWRTIEQIAVEIHNSDEAQLVRQQSDDLLHMDRLPVTPPPPAPISKPDLPSGVNVGNTEVQGANLNVINGWYQKYLGRNAAQSELAAWDGYVTSGKYTTAQIETMIATSPEANMYKASHPATTNTGNSGNVNNTSNVGNAGTNQNTSTIGVGNSLSLDSIRDQLGEWNVPEKIAGFDSLLVLGAVAVGGLWYMTKD